MANYPCSAVILAGGESKQCDDQKKESMAFDIRRAMDRLLSVLVPKFDEIILVTPDPLRCLEWDLVIVTEHFDDRGSLKGIHAGLLAASHPFALVTACAMPFVQSPVIELLWGAVQPHLDVIIPKTSRGLEPMAAIYSKRCLKPMAATLRNRQYALEKFFKQVRTLPIEETELLRCDADLISFCNLDSPEGLTVAERQWGRLTPESI
ncbi:MAG: molybdenum cofactor guanylyltransferase [Desulfobacteraceae bacterium]